MGPGHPSIHPKLFSYIWVGWTSVDRKIALIFNKRFLILLIKEKSDSTLVWFTETLQSFQNLKFRNIMPKYLKWFFNFKTLWHMNNSVQVLVV